LVKSTARWSSSACAKIINSRKTALEKPRVYSIALLENELREFVEFLRSQIQRTG